MEYGLAVLWWLVLLALAVVGLPIAATVFRGLPDRGAPLALPVALVGLFLPVFWIGHLRYGPLAVAGGALILAGLSVLAGRRAPAIDRRRFAEWAAVFTLGFALVVVVRALDPAILPAGGEKFLDYGILTSIRTGERLPPADMWYAGEPLAYYYGGHLLAATLATLTGTATRYAYNLALAGAYGALLATTYGLAGSIAAARGRSYRWAGGLAAFLVGLASNVVTPVQVVLWALPESLAAGLAAFVAERTALPADQLVDPAAFSYWSASRVIPVTINEFPLFAWVNGDLHAHMVDTAFLLLVAAIGFAYSRSPADAVRRRRLLVFGAVPPVGGVVTVVNTWSLPAVVGLTGLAVLFADAPPRDLLPATVADRLPPEGGVDGELARMGSSLVVALATGVLSLAWVLPYVGVLTAGPDTRSIGLLPDRSGLLGLVLVHGWFLAIFAAYLLARRDALGPTRRRGVVAVATVVVLGLLFDAAAVALVLPLLGVAWYLLRRSDRVGYEGVLLVAGAGLVLVVEFVYLVDPSAPGRFNTVFKTYAQVWLLWGLGAGVALADVVPRPRRHRLDASRRQLALGLTVLLVASASLYGLVVLGGHVTDAPEPTLDATSWARGAHAQEWEAIAYLDGRSGQPVVVSAPGCYCLGVESLFPYRWVNAPATFSRARTVAGWDHAGDYHGEAAYRRRVADVEAIYTGDAATRERLLERYDVDYVYVGPNERTLYGEVDLSEAPRLSVAFQNDAVTVYAVGEPGG